MSEADDAFLSLLRQSTLDNKEAWRVPPREADTKAEAELSASRKRLRSKSAALQHNIELHQKTEDSVRSPVATNNSKGPTHEGEKSPLQVARAAIEALNAQPQRASITVRSEGGDKFEGAEQNMVHRDRSRSHHHETLARQAAQKEKAKALAAANRRAKALAAARTMQKQGASKQKAVEQTEKSKKEDAAAAVMMVEENDEEEELHMSSRMMMTASKSDDDLAKECKKRLESEGFVFHIVHAAPRSFSEMSERCCCPLEPGQWCVELLATCNTII